MKKSKNYQAWHVNVNHFPGNGTEEEQAYFLLNFGVLAPSSHNSQPWSFKVEETCIKLFVEQTRRLPVGDANGRQLYISLGCAIENITTAADYYGYSTSVDFNGGNDCVATVRFVKKTMSADPNHLIFSIQKRMVNRSKYQDKQVEPQILNSFKKQEKQNLKITVITDSEVKNKLADIALTATSTSMSDPAFREELSHYVIANTSAKKFGMPGFSLGFPTLISYLAPFMLKTFNMSKLSNKQDEPLLKKFTPYMIVISTKEDSQKEWIEIGRTFQKMFLIAPSHGISFAVWAAPIQIGEYYRDMQKILGIEYRPQMFFRMGYATKDMGGHSPRFRADEVVKISHES